MVSKTPGIEVTIYMASKVRHADKWIALRVTGNKIISTWIDESRDKESLSLASLWVDCVRQAATADVTILYVEPGDELKGALVEVGAALGAGKLVFVVGEIEHSWVMHPCVYFCKDIQEAIEQARKVVVEIGGTN